MCIDSSLLHDKAKRPLHLLHIVKRVLQGRLYGGTFIWKGLPGHLHGIEQCAGDLSHQFMLGLILDTRRSTMCSNNDHRDAEDPGKRGNGTEIGRASCRERV